MRNPHALSPEFAVAMTDLKSGLDRVKLPETAAREFFEELSRESECVCGRPVDEAIRTVIRERARQYLGSDDVSLLNAMKLDVSMAVGESPEQANRELSGKMAALSDLAKTRQNARNELDALKHEAEQANPEVKNAGEEIRRLVQEQKTVRNALEKFDGKDRNIDLSRIGSVSCEKVYSISTVEEAVELLERQLDEVMGTLTLREKRNILAEIVGNAYEKARRDIASEVRDQANARIAEMMPHNNIRIDAIDHCLVLRGQSGGSVGETLSVGYAFLSTLFNRSGQHQLPFIVDSPANPIDYDIRPKIAEIMPNLTGQFIAFMISSEREKFLPASSARPAQKYNTSRCSGKAPATWRRRRWHLPPVSRRGTVFMSRTRGSSRISNLTTRTVDGFRHTKRCPQVVQGYPGPVLGSLRDGVRT